MDKRVFRKTNKAKKLGRKSQDLLTIFIVDFRCPDVSNCTTAFCFHKMNFAFFMKKN